MPLEAGFEVPVRYFEAMSQKVRVMNLKVTGKEGASVPAGSFPCYVVEITPLDDQGGDATLHVMRRAPHHVVKSTYQMPAAMGNATISTELTSIVEGDGEED